MSIDYLAACDAMQQRGGGFACAIAEAYLRADSHNQQRLRAAFCELFAKYADKPFDQCVTIPSDLAMKLVPDLIEFAVSVRVTPVPGERSTIEFAAQHNNTVVNLMAIHQGAA